MATIAGKYPARLLPLLYLGTAHVSLALACVLVAWWPHAVAGFFYHDWMAAIVHLVTLGWLTISILGAMYIVGPLALRMEMPARRLDYVAYGFALVGLVGMVGHFWMQEYGGMAWSAATIGTAIVYMTIRIVRAASRASMPTPVKLHIVLACANIWAAASMGLLLAWDKVAHVLPGFVLSNVFAHAHLAAVGWVTMMIVGVGYRLLPMTFPSKMPSGRSVYASAMLLEVGVLGLFITLLIRSVWVALFGLIIVAGLVAFAAQVAWMVRRRVARPTGAPRIDFGILHAASAGVSLTVAVAIGLALLVLPTSPATLHAAAVYGVFGLVGFLAQIVVGMEARLLPIFAWYWSYANSGYKGPVVSQHAMPWRTGQDVVFILWLFGVPALALGLASDAIPFVGAGAWCLFAATLLDSVNTARILRHAFQTPGRPPATRP